MIDTTVPEDYEPPYGAALAVFGAVLLLYIVTLAPTTAFWDTSEYIATAHIVGIPHPPGNPLFVILGRVWSLILGVFGLPVAVRINLLAAVTSAGASAFLYLIAHRVLAGFFDDRRAAVVGALASSVIGATAYTVWGQSTVNEKVYTVSIFIIAAVSWLAVRWRDQRHQKGSERYLLWAVFLLALGFTNHQMSILPVPALAAFVLLTDLSIVWRKQFMMRVALLGIVGLSFNFVLPVRAELDPVINEGDPTCESVASAAVAIYTNGRRGCEMLSLNLTRAQYQTPPVWQRKAPFGAQLAMYWQYFDWQWARGADASELPGAARLPFTLLFLSLGVVGLYAAWKADKAIFAYLALLMATLSIGLVVYLNFKYGFSLNPEIRDLELHEVRERDYFYTASFLVWGMLAGIGLGWVWHTVAGMAGTARRYVTAAPVLLVAFMPLVLNWSWASRAGDYAARDWAYNLLVSVEPYAVLFTNGDNDTFPLWYLQEVEGIRKDVTVIVGQYLNTSWYPKQLQALSTEGRQRPFDPETVPEGLYTVSEGQPGPILDLSHAQLDGIQAMRLEQDLPITFPTMVVRYPAETVLDRRHTLALMIIRDSIDDRPIYFAASGGMMRELGLDRWGVHHGIAVKLEMRTFEDDPPENWVQGSAAFGAEWFDVDRSLHLYDDVYSFRSIKGRPIWQDRSTTNIPWQYYGLTAMLADALQAAEGDPEVVQRLSDDSLGFQVVAQGGVRGTPGLVQ